MSFPRYPKYKDSGVEWLGEVPEHWVVKPIRLAAKLESGHTPSRSHPEYWEECTVPWITLSDVWQIREGNTKYIFETKEKVSELGLANSSARLLPKNTVILSRTASVGFSAIMGVDMATTQDFANWVCGPLVLPEFLLNVFRSMHGEFRRLMMGSTHNTIYMPDIQSLRFTQPPLPEQCLIASFLDRETAKIDGLVGEQRRLIELLKEKRQAVISHAVTKGLNPHAPLKPSGIEWLGEVPEHWEVVPLKHLCVLLKDGTHLPPERVVEGIPLLSVRNVVDGEFVPRDDDSMIAEKSYEDLCRAFVPQAEDVLLAIVGATLGKTAIVPSGLGPFHIQRSLAIFRTRPEALQPTFLNLVFQSHPFQSLLWELVGYSAQPGIYLGTLQDVRIPVPPLGDQLHILELISARTNELTGLTAEAQRGIDLLQERRTALISAAVTGKIDVRGLIATEAA